MLDRIMLAVVEALRDGDPMVTITFRPGELHVTWTENAS